MLHFLWFDPMKPRSVFFGLQCVCHQITIRHLIQSILKGFAFISYLHRDSDGLVAVSHDMGSWILLLEMALWASSMTILLLT